MLEGVGDNNTYINVFAYATDSERYRSIIYYATVLNIALE